MSKEHIILLITGIVLLVLASIYIGLESAFGFINQSKLDDIRTLKTKQSERLIALCSQYESLMLSLLLAKNICLIIGSYLCLALLLSLSLEPASIIICLVILLIILIIAVITPKIFANAYPVGMALRFSVLTQITKIVLTPIIGLSHQWKALITWMFKLSEGKVITERELLYFLDEAEKEGSIEEHEKDLIQSAIEFENQKVEDVLTPRVDLVAISDEETTESIEEKFEKSGFSRLPVYQGTVENIIGFIHEKDYYREMRLGNMSLSNIVKSVIYVTPQMSIAAVLTQLQLGKTHIAVVIDEYGGTMGIVTLEDIIEELVGEIWDEYDKVIEYIIPIRDHVYRVNCELGLQKFFDEFDLHSDYDDYDATLVNGWVIQMMGELPKVNDQFKFENIIITILSVSNKKVLDIMVEVLDKEEE